MPLDDTNKTTEELKAELAAIEEKQRELEEQYASAKEKQVDDLVEHVKQTAAEYGLDQAEIAARLMPASTGKRGGKKTRTHFKCRQTGNVFRGGKYPRWLVEQLSKSGLDYSEYKEHYMEPVA